MHSQQATIKPDSSLKDDSKPLGNVKWIVRRELPILPISIGADVVWYCVSNSTLDRDTQLSPVVYM